MIFAAASSATGEDGKNITTQPFGAVPLKTDAHSEAGKDKRSKSGASLTVNRPASNAIQALTGLKQSASGSTQLRLDAGRTKSGFAVPRRDPFNPPFNLVARRGEQLAKAQASFCTPAADVRQRHELAGMSVVPLKIADKAQDTVPHLSPRPADAGLAGLHADTALHAKPDSQSPSWRPNGFHKPHVDPVASPEQRPGPAGAPDEHRAGLAPLLLISFLIGAAGAALVPAVSGQIAALVAALSRSGGNFTDIGWTSDPLALPRMNRDNRLSSYLDFVINRGTKQPYVELPLAESGSAGAADATAESDSLDAEARVENETSSEAEALTAGPETPIEGGIRSLPSLYFDPATGKQVIGDFATRSFPGDHAACTEIAQSMLLDARARQDALYTLADTREIKVMRFCAVNGSVMITCRNERITISPRRPRPNDGCRNRQALL